MIKTLKEQVWEANLELERSGLVKLTWGNVSGLDRDKGVWAIKPSGVPYSELKPTDLVVLDLDGKVVEGKLNPSTDTPTHLELYRKFSGIGGVTHTHSVYATAYAQAGCELPCLGTSHADHFSGAVPVTRELTPREIQDDYEGNTGKVIVERLAGMEPMDMPAVLVAHHAPFTWGKDAMDSVHISICLETAAQIALSTLQIRPDTPPIPRALFEKHFFRKHGPNATYGQKP